MAEQSSSSSFSYGFTYDVFLNFRGSDTRHGFIGHLWKALHDKGIRTFIDDKELQRGDEITPSLVKAIQDSRIAIPVFSKDYASSTFCLDELVNIIHNVKAQDRLVLPIFYDVDPSHVRYQMGSYGEALAKHEERFTNDKEKLKDNKERLQKWKMALNQVADLSGHHFEHGIEYEHEFIGRIVKEVSDKINRAPLHVAHYPVGLEHRVLEVKSLLEFGYGGVFMVGIFGIGGIGKTTLARAVYNFIADHFEGLCFLEDVKENSTKGGLVHLQEILLSEIVGEKDIKIGSVSKGISMIKHRLQQKKVLLILDNVDKLEQLRAIAGRPDWFGFGSRVIITTRDKHLLRSHGIERIYEVEDLNEKEALELLSWIAFKDDKIDPNYRNILNRIVAYASGLPLALEVIGSNLFGKSIEEWKYVLDRYERVPNKEIQKILEVSYDALEEEEQRVFLDIACCFRFYPLTEVENILHAHHGDCMKHQIRVLVEKSLIKINQFGQVTLHDLIEDMGKEIVRQESLEEPGKRSRLWFPKDIVEVLEDNTGTNIIEMIYLDFPLFEEVEVKWDGEAFKKMENLKTLIIRKGSFSNDPKHLPNSLRVFEWQEYPSKYLPHDFHPKKIVICKLPDTWFTSLELVGLLEKKFENIKVLNIGMCECLTHIPNVSGLPNLEEFSFACCYNLTKIDDSIGFLDKLRILDASGCIKIDRFPPIKLTSLERLELSYCLSLESFPEILGKMENMTELTISGTPLKGLPFSFRNLSRLQKLNIHVSGMSFWLPNNIVMMQELAEIVIDKMWLWTKLAEVEEKWSSMVSSNVEHLQMRNCYVSDETFRTCITWFANVKELVLIGISNFTFLPECIKECRFLKRLILDICCRLREIRGIPPNLQYSSALDCASLTYSSRSMLLNQELHEAGNTFFCVPGSRTPEWFEHQSMGPSISFWFRNKMPVMALCFVIEPMDTDYDIFRPIVIINEKTITIEQSDESCRFCFAYPQLTDHIVILGTRHINFEDNIAEVLSKNEWNHVVVSIGLDSTPVPAEMLVKRTGLYVFEQENCMEDIQFTNPALRKQEQEQGQRREWLSLLPSKPFNDNMNLDSNLMVSSQMNSYTDVQVLKENSLMDLPKEKEEKWESEQETPKMKSKVLTLRNAVPRKPKVSSKPPPRKPPIIKVKKNMNPHTSKSKIAKHVANTKEVPFEYSFFKELMKVPDVENIHAEDFSLDDRGPIVFESKRPIDEDGAFEQTSKPSLLSTNKTATMEANITPSLATSPRQVKPIYTILPQKANYQVPNEGYAKEKTTRSKSQGTQTKVNLPIDDLDAVNKLIEEDPLNAIEKLLNGEVSISSMVQQSIQPEVHIEDLLKELRELLTSLDLGDLITDYKQRSNLFLIIQNLEKNSKSLSSTQQSFVQDFKSFFTDIIFTQKQFDDAVTREVELNLEKEKILHKLQVAKTTQERINTSISTTNTRVKEISSLIDKLKEQLMKLEKERESFQLIINEYRKQEEELRIDSTSWAHQARNLVVDVIEVKAALQFFGDQLKANKNSYAKFQASIPF